MTDICSSTITIPPLQLENNSDSFQVGNTSPYTIAIDVLAQGATDPWKPSPGYTPILQIDVPIGSGAGSLTSVSDGAKIKIISNPTRLTLIETGTKTIGNQEYQCFELQILELPDGLLIGNATADQLNFQIGGIYVNNDSGTAKINFRPGLKLGQNTTYGSELTYSIQKETSPFFVGDIQWKSTQPVNKMGEGTLSWKTGGNLQYCTISANGESIGLDQYTPPTSGPWSAKLLLESGNQFITVTGYDDAHNSNTGGENLALSGQYNDFYALDTANFDTTSQTFKTLSPLSLVQVDAASQLSKVYAIFRDSSGTAGLYQNTFSGTQNNWDSTPIATLPAGFESSPCVYLGNEIFYLVGGSLSDPTKTQAEVQYLDTSSANPTWTPLTAYPSPWPEPIMGQTVIVINSEIWVIGGFGSSGTVYNTVYKFNASSGWKAMPAMPQALCIASAAVAGNTLYLFSGYPNGPLSSPQDTLYSCDVSTGAWTTLPVAFPNSSGVVASGLVYWFLGTVDDKLYASVYCSGQSSTWYYSSSAPNEWQNQETGNLQHVAISSVSSQPYGITTNSLATTIDGDPVKLLLFMMEVNEATTPQESAYAYFYPDPSNRSSEDPTRLIVPSIGQSIL